MQVCPLSIPCNQCGGQAHICELYATSDYNLLVLADCETCQSQFYATLAYEELVKASCSCQSFRGALIPPIALPSPAPELTSEDAEFLAAFHILPNGEKFD